MFSGIVIALGSVKDLTLQGESGKLVLTADSFFKELHAADRKLTIGESVLVNGVCLTVVEFAKDQITFDLASETLRLTNLGTLKLGDKVNLEPSLRLNDVLSGHLVSGHIDGRGKLSDRIKEGETEVLTFSYPSQLAPFLTLKGSITIEGVSLTVGEVTTGSFKVYIVPHTASVTTLGLLRTGDLVNLEIDVIARYVQRQLEFGLSPIVNRS